MVSTTPCVVAGHRDLGGGRAGVLEDVVDAFLHDPEKVDAQILGEGIVDVGDVVGKGDRGRTAGGPDDAFDRLRQAQAIELKRSQRIRNGPCLIDGRGGFGANLGDRLRAIRIGSIRACSAGEAGRDC